MKFDELITPPTEGLRVLGFEDSLLAPSSAVWPLPSVVGGLS
ncbi:hypothetical protein BH09PSE1_BH09PSE1_05200 [soil metagenome]